MLGRGLRRLGGLGRAVAGVGLRGAGGFSSSSAHTTLVRLAVWGLTLGGRPCAATFLVKGAWQRSQVSLDFVTKIELKSLILAQIERWRHALHMQVERQRGGNPGGERRTGE